MNETDTSTNQSRAEGQANNKDATPVIQSAPKEITQIKEPKNSFDIRRIWKTLYSVLRTPTLTDWLIAVFTAVLASSAIDAGHQTTKIIAADERLAQGMEKSVTTAGRGLDATIAQNQLDQRAWVGLDGFGGNPQVGKPFVLTAQLRNTGRTPALKFTSRAEFRPVARGEQITFAYTVPAGAHGLLEPNGIFDISLNPVPVFTEENMTVYKSGQQRYYFYGRITYDDIFHKSHWLTYCSYLDPISTTFKVCDSYNETDSN